MTSLCREQGRRGVTLQIPKALQWDIGSGPVAMIDGTRHGTGCQLFQANRRKEWERGFFPSKVITSKVHSESFLKVLFASF